MKETENLAPDFNNILNQFAIQGAAAEIKPFGSGHIHDTYRIKNKYSEAPDYILQRMNHQVFKNIPGLMQNIELVTAHLRQKLGNIPGASPDAEVLTLVQTQDQKSFYQDATGNYWRVFLFLSDTCSYDLVETVQQAYEGGKAFGRFQALLADLPVDLIVETIPDFHNVVNRLRLFRLAIAADRVKRVKEVATEIAFVEARAESMSAIYKAGQKGELPLRITHNDTKFNNVLLNKNNEAQCVIDLDTVMPGYVAYDFGDAVRTIVNSSPEDEPDLERIQVKLELLAGFAEGFLKETRSFLSEAELASLAQGVLLLPFIMGLRFLTDYIDGDNYYKIHFPGHNLQRARAQFELVRKLEEQYPAIQNIINQAWESAYIY